MFFQESAAGAGHAASRGRPSGMSAPGRAIANVRGAPALSGERSLAGLAASDRAVNAALPRGPVHRLFSLDITPFRGH